MTWLDAHWWQVLTAWSVLNVVLSSVATQVPATSGLGKALHVFVAISPLDVVKAFKSLGAAAVPPVAGALLVLCLFGCSGTSPPTPATLNATAQDVAVGAYESELLLCVAQAATKVATDTCRLQVRGYWCGHGLPPACVDGGGS
jgi:hypothetical protein